MTDRDKLIQEFKSVTNQEDERSTFYLESANWELNVALSSFYDTMGEAEIVEGSADTSQSASDQDVEYHDAQDEVRDSRNVKAKSSANSNARFYSLTDLDQESDDSEEGQEFYAGGSVNSGEVILGPGKKSGEDLVNHMFKSAKKHGAMEVDQPTSSTAKRKGGTHFPGGGYRLGVKSDDHQFVPGLEKPREERRHDVILRLWKDGFTIGDGPLRSYQDEESRQFLGAVAQGEIPEELTRTAQGSEINLDMEDHKHEKYRPERKKVKPFTGDGHKLGSAVPVVAGSQSALVEPTVISQTGPDVVIDEGHPVTTVRIQMGNGSRITQRFNYHHTVAQVYSFVRDWNQDDTRNFVLMTTFPNKELQEDGTTLKESNLLNAVIVQRCK